MGALLVVKLSLESSLITVMTKVIVANILEP